MLATLHEGINGFIRCSSLTFHTF